MDNQSELPTIKAVVIMILVLNMDYFECVLEQLKACHNYDAS